jgi:hypothetical protein
MNAQIIFQFLKDIAANNDREWFNAHHDEYEAAKLEFENFLAQVIARVSAFDDSVRPPPATRLYLPHLPRPALLDRKVALQTPYGRIPQPQR